MGVPAIKQSSTLGKGRFLELELVEYTDSEGKPRQWESCQRVRNQQAVIILATLKQTDRLLLIRQFRVPVGTFCLEVPAGLIDAGESPAEAAVRELMEETGYVGTIDWVAPMSSSSAGMTGECVTLVVMTIDESLPENVHPRQHLDDGEEIEVLAVRKADLPALVQRCQAAGDIPDSRLMAWMAGQGLRW